MLLLWYNVHFKQLLSITNCVNAGCEFAKGNSMYNDVYHINIKTIGRSEEALTNCYEGKLFFTKQEFFKLN